MAKDNMEDYKKKYEDIVDRIKTMANDLDQPFVVRKAIEEQFPKIVVSDDEKVRKTLIGIFTYYNEKSHFFNSEVTKSKVLTWLEKQGEKKSEWTPMDEQHVENLLALIEGHGYPGEVAWLNSLEDRVQPKQGEQKPVRKFELDENGEPILTPFEAELFSMMSDAWQGYQNGEEVNITKIVKEHSEELLERANEQKSSWSEEDSNLREATIGLLNLISPIDAKSWGKSRLDCIEWLKDLKERVGCEADCTTTKDWSGEDERILIEMLTIFGIENFEGYNIGKNNEDALKFLKSIKGRVQSQPKQEWSEDDEYYRNIIMYCLNGECVGNADKENAVLWLKDLRSQNRWKPSDGQMDSITCAVRKMKESACYDSELVSLLNDLNKLKETMI